MARSVLAIPYVDAAHTIHYTITGILVECGFKEKICNGEKIWYNENDENDIVSCVKIDYDIYVFVCSSWMIKKDDTDSYREYFPNEFKNTEAKKNLDEFIREVVLRFGDKIKEKTIYVFEK